MGLGFVALYGDCSQSPSRESMVVAGLNSEPITEPCSLFFTIDVWVTNFDMGTQDTRLY